MSSEYEGLTESRLIVLTRGSRILTAIQKFEQTRRLTPERRDVFYKWLHYGSIVIAPNIGGDHINTETMDKDEIATAKSQVVIPNELRENLDIDNPEKAKYAVDFLGCMKGFLSRRATEIWAFDTKEKVDLVTSTLERFMDYLLQHDVCPEYADEILETRNFCRDATDEIWSCVDAQRWLPGDFNIACSTLFGGNYGRDYDGETYWGDMEKASGNVFVGQTAEEATQIFGYALAGAASEEVFRRYYSLWQGEEKEEGLRVVQIIKDHNFKIIDLVDPTADCKDMYKQNTEKYRPVGKMIARAWKNPLAPPEDLSDDDEQDLTAEESLGEVYIFFIEEIIMQNLSVGQTISATVHKLNCGVWFFDEFTQIHPDFDTLLMNGIMEDYKEPRWVRGAYAPGAPGWKAEENGEDVEEVTAPIDEPINEVDETQIVPEVAAKYELGDARPLEEGDPY